MAAILFHLSSSMITFGELSLYTFHFYWFIPIDHQKWKIQGHFQLERRKNGESANENALRKGDSLIQVSLICLTRPYLTKLLFKFRYTNQYLYYGLDTTFNTEIQYSTKRSHLRKNWTKTGSFALLIIIFHAQRNYYVASKNI